MSYKVTINTSSYKKRKCSEKNWEPGTMNDYMEAINGWKCTENSLREVTWRIKLFCGISFVPEEYENGDDSGLSNRYKKWLSKRCNKVKYHDQLCNIDRSQYLSGYGFMQGYFSIEDKIKTLKEKGTVRIYFHELYDLRQYHKNMDGCFMEITKQNRKVS